MGNIHPKIKEAWEWLKHNTGAVVATTAIIMVILGILGLFFSYQANRKNGGRPNLKIKSVYFKRLPYGNQSLALRFYIPIKNEGNATAYNIEIKEKFINLVAKRVGLNDSSVQTKYTSSPFYIKPRDTIEDTIFIDESPAYMKKVERGDAEISLEYRILFYANKKKDEPYEYQYRISYSKGKFHDKKENLLHLVKP